MKLGNPSVVDKSKPMLDITCSCKFKTYVTTRVLSVCLERADLYINWNSKLKKPVRQKPETQNTNKSVLLASNRLKSWQGRKNARVLL